jgi:hypothetical protein
MNSYEQKTNTSKIGCIEMFKWRYSQLPFLQFGIIKPAQNNQFLFCFYING